MLFVSSISPKKLVDDKFNKKSAAITGFALSIVSLFIIYIGYRFLGGAMFVLILMNASKAYNEIKGTKE